MRVPQRWFVERVTIESYQGSGPYGDAFADPVTVLGHVSGGRRVSRGGGGDEVTSERLLMLPNPCRRADDGTEVDPSQLLLPESRVTSGAISAVVTEVAEHRQPGTGVVVYVSGALT